jgi:pentatricopeptide repeat protein
MNSSLNKIREGIPQVAKSLPNKRNFTFSSNKPMNSEPQIQNYSYQPMLFTYANPYIYTSIPTYYTPIAYPYFQPIPYQSRVQSSVSFPNSHYKMNSFVEGNFFRGFKNNFGYCTFLEQPYMKEKKLLDIHQTVDELHKNILECMKIYNECKISWFNRMIAKCNTGEDFKKAIEIFKLFQQKMINTTPETGTLMIKAACRANIPEKMLSMLKKTQKYRIFPTLGGIHYLMINFSLKKNTQAVIESYEVAKLRGLKPNARTFHILIRECVDNNLINDAMTLFKDCKIFGVIPNRVTYNILMNGCRKFNKPKKILKLRKEMNEYNIEINDTTIKFTTLAYMMLGDKENAVKSFLEYPNLENNMENFCNKFINTAESDNQKQCIIDLFQILKKEKEITLPNSIETMLNQIESSIKLSKNEGEAS